MVTAWIVAATMVALAAVAVRRLPPLHPGQLWAVPWAAMMLLFALQLLPYRDLRTDTAILIVLAGAGFVASSWFAGRGASRTVEKLSSTDAERLWWAMLLTVGAAATGAALFVLEIAADYGLRAAVVSSPEVRTAIQSGATVLTIKYVYVAFAAALLGGVYAARAPTAARRNVALGVIVLASFLNYLSTSRSNIFTAVLIGTIAYLIARERPPSGKQALAGIGFVLAVGVAALLIGGSIIGKTFDASELSTMDSVFTRHDQIQMLASPYQYATAPAGAFNELVSVSPDIGGDFGCATFPLVCDVTGAAGVGPSGTNSLRPFTNEPLRWNTYTGLDAPLMDGGKILAVPIVMILGLLAGWVWRLARSASLPWVFAYVMVATAALTSTGQNRFFAYHYLGAVMIAVASWFLVSRTLPGRWTREATV